MQVLRETSLDLRRTLRQNVISSVSLILAILALVSIYIVGSIAREVLIATSEQQYGRSTTVADSFSLGLATQTVIRQDLSIVKNVIVTGGSRFALTSTAGVVVPNDESLENGTSSLSLVAGSMNGIRRMPIMVGRWFDVGSAVYPGGVVVNQAAAASLGGLGSRVSLRPDLNEPEISESVVGVVADGDQNANVYASMLSVLQDRPAALDGQSLTLTVHNSNMGLAAITMETSDALSLMGVSPLEIDVQEMDQVAQISGEVDAIQAAFAVVGLISLIVATVGLVNIGLANVTERSRELTIRRAIGAARWRVFLLVMSSSLATGIIASVLAISSAATVESTVVPPFLNRTLELQVPTFPWDAAVIALIAGFASATIGGLLPALRAIRVDLTAALRE